MMDVQSTHRKVSIASRQYKDYLLSEKASHYFTFAPRDAHYPGYVVLSKGKY